MKRRSVQQPTKLNTKPKSIVIEGNDPGSKNWGLAVVRFIVDEELRVVDFRPVLLRQLKNTPTGKGKDDEKVFAGFSHEKRDIFSKYKPHSVVIERYLPRGNGGAHNAEQVGIGCGITFEICRQENIRCRRIMPASWKNALNKKLKNLQEAYPKFMNGLVPIPSARKTKPFKNEIERCLYPINKAAIHVIDALLMTLYDVDEFYFLSTRTGYLRLVRVIKDIIVPKPSVKSKNSVK